MEYHVLKLLEDIVMKRCIYEVLDIVELMKTVDSHIIVNVIKTENFFGGFYRPPID